MARASTPTKLALDEWARILQIHPLHFNGLVHESETASCRAPWPQYSWQTADRLSREEVAAAIAQAEADIERVLGYRLLPSWESEEWHPTQRHYHREMDGPIFGDIRDHLPSVRSSWGRFVSGGVRAAELLGMAAVVYTDDDGDGYAETAEATLASAVEPAACEVRAFVAGQDGRPEAELRPLREVEVGPASIRVQLRREQLLKSALLETLSMATIDADVDANFESEIEFWRVYNDPQTQVTLMWEPTSLCGCDVAGSCPSCSFTVQTGCLVPRGDPAMGAVAYQPADWDVGSASFSPTALALDRAPDVVRLFYLAGLAGSDQQAGSVQLRCSQRDMEREWARTVAYYAASMLDRPPCDCSAGAIERWTVDLALRGGVNEQLQQAGLYDLAPGDLANPLGTRAGAVYAWHRVNGEGVALGRVALA